MRRLLVIVVAIACSLLLGVWLGAAMLSAAPTRRPAVRAVVPLAPASLTATVGDALRPVPRSFLGLSAEYWTPPLWDTRPALLQRVIMLLTPEGDGPFVLRIGGSSADQTYWGTKDRPGRGYGLTERWVTQMRELVAGAQIRLVLDLDLVTGSVAADARWVAVARRAFGRALAAFEVGNEPDTYSRRTWLHRLALTSDDAALLPARMGLRQYLEQFADDDRMVARAAPGVPVAGPAIAHPRADARWLRALAGRAHARRGARLGLLTAHLYPYSACVSRRSARYPTVGRLLSWNASHGLARYVATDVRIARAAHVPLRITELNSVTCGGRPGVSDTFATALWAPDALFSLMAAGVDGANIHARQDKINGPFRIMPRLGLEARPLFYGLVLFARALGPDAVLDRVQVTGGGRSVSVWAVRVATETLHVLLLNKSDRPVNARLRLPVSGPATVQRLTAPAVTATTGERLAGQWLGADGRWQGEWRTSTVRRSGSGYRLTVPAGSAALLSVPERTEAEPRKATTGIEPVWTALQAAA
jgi:hypothetical protein